MAFDEFDGNEDTVGNRILKWAAGRFLSPVAGLVDSTSQSQEETGFGADRQSLPDPTGIPVGARIVDLAAQTRQPSRIVRPASPPEISPDFSFLVRPPLQSRASQPESSRTPASSALEGPQTGPSDDLFADLFFQGRPARVGRGANDFRTLS